MTRRYHELASPVPVESLPDWLDNARRLCLGSSLPSLLVAGTGGQPWVLCNETMAALLGRTGAVADPLPAAALLGECWPALAARLSEAGDQDWISLTLALPEPLGLRAVPVREGGTLRGWLATVAMDEAMARLDERMRGEVARTAAARSRFLASASHDLRQPFQAMRLFLDALNAQVAEMPRAKRTADMLGNAMTAGERLLNALLDISTLDAGTVEPDLQPVALHELLDSLAEEFRPQAEEKGLRLRVRLRPAMTHGDPVLLGRIVRNLLSNAIRYTQRGGILLGLRRQGGRWRIEVWDTGFGIPRDKQDVIFDEFHQLTNPSRDPTRGLGLGLAIVRRLSALLRAPVDVRSRPGRGSVFTITVESGVVEPPPPAQSHPSIDRKVESGDAEATPLAGMTLLVVDDDAMVLTGLRLALEAWGCTIVPAADMREVFAAVDAMDHPPDAILTDLRLPGNVSGFDVIDRVRRLFRRDISAVVLTGETAPDSLLEGQRRGCTFLHKPLHPGELRRVLEELRSEGAG